MENDKMKYINGIMELLGSFKENKRGEFITDIPIGTLPCTMYVNSDGAFMFMKEEGEEQKKYPLTELDEEKLFDIYVHLDANKYTLTSREAVIEHEEVTEKQWLKEPIDIKGEDGEVIGLIGVAVEETVGEDRLCRVIFISPDKTWSTLTMFNDHDPDAVEVAKRDLISIADTLINYQI